MGTITNSILYYIFFYLIPWTLVRDELFILVCILYSLCQALNEDIKTKVINNNNQNRLYFIYVI